jgi:hypothetical protein
MVLDRSRTPAILDIEASGFGKGSYPIEIGVATEESETKSWLIKPEQDWTHWHEEAEALHKITRNDLLTDGLSSRDVVDQLNELLEGQTVYSDGWGFDSGWLSLLFYVANRKMLFKLETLPRILSPYQLEIWDKTKAELRQKHGLVHHRAADDAKLIQLTFQKTLIDEQLS